MGIEYAFVPIPHALLYDTRISLGAKVVYTFVKSRCLDKDYCLVGQERLAEEMGMGLRTVERYIAELKKFGLIEIRQRMGTSGVTVFAHIPDLYTSCDTPFESHPLDLDSCPAESGGPDRQIWRDDSATSGGPIPPSVADKEEEDKKETDIGQDSGMDLMDLLEEDPAIQKALAHEEAQEQKAKDAAKRRLDQPSIPRGKKAKPPDFSAAHKETVPRSVTKWDGSKWFSRFKSAMNSHSIEVSPPHRHAALTALTRVRGMLSRQGMKAPEQYKLLCQWLPDNWSELQSKFFKSRGREEGWMISITTLASFLPRILKEYEDESSGDLLDDPAFKGRVTRIKI